MSEPAWLAEGRKDIGFHETGENRGIDKFIEQSHCGTIGDPWCAIWVNAKLESVGIRGTRSPAAASFTESSNFTRLSEPRLGCICTFARTGGNHVGFYVGQDSQGLLILGGNQGDQVCIEHHANNPTGFWWPVQAATQPGSQPQQSGKGSWYSQYSGKYSWVDSGDAPNSAALGCPDDAQGIALPPRETLGRWFAVRAPNGKVSIEQQTDRGPAESTGRSIDISGAAAERFGYSPKSFPTNGVFTWWPIDPPKEVAGLSPKEQAVRYRDIRKDLPVPDATEPTSPPIAPIHPEIKLGSTGPAVTEVQKLLGLPQSGFFDLPTDAAVRAFQTAHGLEVDGEVGEFTWPMLIDPSKAPPPIQLPSLSGPKFDLAKFVEFIDAHKDEAHKALTTGIAIFNTLHPDKPISLPGILAAPVPSPTGTPITQRPSVQFGAIGVAIASVLQATGHVGLPFGLGGPELATLTGTMSTLLPAITAGLGMFGVWGKIAAGALTAIGPLVNAAAATSAKKPK